MGLLGIVAPSVALTGQTARASRRAHADADEGAGDRPERAHELRHSRRPSRPRRGSCTVLVHRLAATQALHLIADHSGAKPTNITRRSSLSTFSLLPFTTPNIYFIRATLTPPHTLPHPPHALYHTSLVPACPCPTHRPSCDSTTIRLTTPTLPLRHITSFFPFVTNPPSLPVA
jgi:hypothetical protein